MKLRKGFISNSSSSSFMIGVGKVNDLDKLKKELAKIKKVDYKLIQLKDIKNSYDVHVGKSTISVESFTGDSVNLKNLSPEDWILYFSEFGPHDDSDFWNEEYGEYDYDIDLTFEPNQEKIRELITNKKFFDDFDITIGAGRNG